MFQIAWVDTGEIVSPASYQLRSDLASNGYAVISIPLQNFPPFYSDYADSSPNNEEFGHAPFVKGSVIPDLVILDMACSDNNPALDLCRYLRKNSATQLVPIIVCLSLGEDEDNDGGCRTPVEAVLLNCFESGASDVLNLCHNACNTNLVSLPKADEGDEQRKIPAQPGWLIEAKARIKAAIHHGSGASQSVALARQLDQLNEELYERNLQVERELYIARQLQQSLLPPFLKDDVEKSSSGITDPDILAMQAALHFSKCHYRNEFLRVSGVYLPCDTLGGDLYDVSPFPDGSLGVSVADVSGHGVPAAFITAIFKSCFYRITHSHHRPDNILFHLNNELNEIIKSGDYVTAFYTRIARENGVLSLTYSAAGHPYPLLYKHKTGELLRLNENATPLVWIKDMAYPIGEHVMEPGDKILIFTDGVTEMRNSNKEFYGEEKLEEHFVRLAAALKPKQSGRLLLDGIIETLSDFAEGHPIEDDLSMVLIEAL